MKRKQKLVVVGTLFAVLTLFGLSTFSLAWPGQTDECSTCHINIGNLGLSSNITGSLNANVGDSFAVLFTADSGTGAIAIESTWVDNDQFFISHNLIEDNEPEDTNPTVGEITTEITFTPQAAGNFTIRIWAAGSSGESSSLDLEIDVSQATVTQTSTTTTTTTTEVDERVEIWYMMMYTVIPASAVVLVILGYLVLKTVPKE